MENTVIKYSSSILIKKIAEGIKQSDEYEVKTALELIANEDTSVIEKINDSIESSANYYGNFHDWVVAICKSINT